MAAPKTLLITLLGASSVAVIGLGGYLAVQSGEELQPPVQASPPPVGGEVTREEATPKPRRPSAPTPSARVAEGAAASPAGRQASSRKPTESVIAPPAEATPALSAHADGPSAATPAPSPSPSAPIPQAAAVSPPEPIEPPAAAPEPPARRSTREEIVVPKERVIGIRLETPVSSETSKKEDRVTARVIRDVAVDGVTVVPAGARLEGVVTLVEQGGRARGQARVGMRFTSVVLGTDMKVPIQTEQVIREGESPGNEATAKIGAAAVVGTILGSMIGGGKGAAIGGAVGAAGGTATVMTGGRNAATIAAGTELTVRLAAPLTITVERDDQPSR